MLAKTLTAFAVAQSDAPSTVGETGPPRLSNDELRGQAQSLVQPGSVLDGIHEPVRMEDVRAELFKRAFPDIAVLAFCLGYGYVNGRGASYNGGGYHYVPTGEEAGEDYNRAKGPGFRPEMNGPAEGYMNEKRTSFHFPDVWLRLSEIEYDTPRVIDHGVNEIVSVEIDNGRGVSPIETTLMLEYYRQGSVESAISRNWHDSINWQLTANQTVNFGDPAGMFPKTSLSFTESLGGSHSRGGSESSVKTVQEAQRVAVTERVRTDAHTRETYGMTAATDHCIVPFSATATLEFSVAIHGFLRWGCDQRFQKATNFHNKWSGSGERPTVDFKLGGPGRPWWEAAREAAKYNSEPWNWKAMMEQHPWVREMLDRVNGDEYQQRTLSFPINGVIGGVSRRNVKFETLKSQLVLDPAEAVRA